MWVSKQAQRIGELDKQVQELALQLAKLDHKELARDRHVRELEVEWKSTFEKFNTLWARLQRRIPKKEPEDRPGGTNGEPPVLNPLAVALTRAGRI